MDEVVRKHVRLQVLTGPHTYADVIVERSVIREVRRVAHTNIAVQHPSFSADQHCEVVTGHTTYTVFGQQETIAEKIWPRPDFCRECKRPLQ